MTTLTLGSKLPSFIGTDQNGASIDSATLIGKNLVIYFYPKDDTPGCTAQACSIRDGQEALLSAQVQVIGISADSVASHTKFVNKYQLNFPLISDPEKTIIQLFGVWGLKKFMGREYEGIHRMTFLFDQTGTLIKVIEKPNTKDHANEVLAYFK
ncbi:MAG: thioredoxin-dependent thiol peroxidase [Flavobacteriales bacterium]